MPGPNVINKAKQDRAAEANQRATYYLTDPECREILGMPVTDKMRDEGLVLTENEAMMFVASGALTTDKANAQKAVEDFKARHDALMASQKAAADADAANREAASAASLHNAGVETMDEGKVNAANEAVKSGTLSEAEVDQKMAEPVQPATPEAATEQASQTTPFAPASAENTDQH